MASSSRESGIFSSLPPWEMPWSDFVLSYGIQAVVVAIFVWIPVLHPEILERPKLDYHAIELVPTPVPVNHEPQRQLRKPILVAKLDPPPEALRLPAPRPQLKPKVEEAPAPEVKIATRKLDPLPPTTGPASPKQIVRTNVFSTGSSAAQTTERAPQQVQTGGFGDPNGVPAKASQNKAVNIAQAYLRNLPETRGLEARFSFTSGEGGQAIFESKGCVKCHVGKLALADRLHNLALTEIAVDMWNHAPRMIQPVPQLSEDEMRQ